MSGRNGASVPRVNRKGKKLCGEPALDILVEHRGGARVPTVRLRDFFERLS